MRRFKVSVGEFPAGIKGVRLYYSSARLSGWVKLTESRVPTFEVDISEDGPVDLRAHGLDANGSLLAEYRENKITGTEVVSDREDPATVTIPVPKVEQDGPTATLSNFTWSGAIADEYEVEVRTSDTSTAAIDAVTQGIHEASEPVTVTTPPDETDIRTHVRLLRKSDGATSGWETNAVELASPDVEGVADHSTDFAGGTLETVDGQAALEINSGDLRQKIIYAGDVTGVYAGDLNSLYAGDAGKYWSPVTYTTADFATGANDDLQFQLYPEATSMTRLRQYAGDAKWYPRSPIEQTDGTPHDGRILDTNTLNGRDETPLRVDFEVATSATASPSFTSADFVAHHPGRIYPNVHTYAVRAKVYTYREKLVTLDKIHVRRWVFCKTKPWCSHSSGGRLLYHTTLTADTTVVDWSVVGNDWDELIVEVDWLCNKTADSEFELHFNGTNTNDVVPSGQTVALNDWERLRFRVLPKTGRQRRTILDHAYTYDGITGAKLAGATAGLVDEWTDTSTAITSIRFTTDDPASDALGTGSTIRVWGRRYHDGA